MVGGGGGGGGGGRGSNKGVSIALTVALFHKSTHDSSMVTNLVRESAGFPWNQRKLSGEMLQQACFSALSKSAVWGPSQGHCPQSAVWGPSQGHCPQSAVWGPSHGHCPQSAVWGPSQGHCPQSAVLGPSQGHCTQLFGAPSHWHFPHSFGQNVKHTWVWDAPSSGYTWAWLLSVNHNYVTVSGIRFLASGGLSGQGPSWILFLPLLKSVD